MMKQSESVLGTGEARPQSAITARLITSAAEASQACAAGTDRPLFLCTNAAAHSRCSQAGAESVLLDESFISADYKRINSWAYRQAFSLLDAHRRDPDLHALLDANFIDVKAAYVQAVKCALVLRIIRERRDGLSVLEVSVPEKDSVLALSAQALGGLQVRSIGSGQDVPPAAPGSTGLKDVLGKILSQSARDAARGRDGALLEGRVVLFSGSLRHLSGIMTEMARRGKKLAYCEDSFNLEKYLFCLRRGITFLVLDPATAEETLPGRLLQPKSAVYDGIDLTQVVERTIRGASAGGWLRHPYDRTAVKQLFESGKVEAVVLDEDFALRRYWFAQARRYGKPSVVISHGIPALYLEDAPDLRGRYETSLTLMNSPFEKSCYESIYYDPSRLQVTGLPRYDRIARLAAEPSPARRSKQRTVLYCTSEFTDYDFRSFLTVLGCKEFLGDFTKKYLEDLITVLADEPNVLLKIKPHYSGARSCEELIRALPRRGRYELLPHTADIALLEKQADVIVTPESTVITEALMFGKPVIAMNYGPEPLSTPEYLARRIVWQASDIASLREGLKACLWDDTYLKQLCLDRAASLAYFCGEMDGQNTRRAVERIEEVLLARK